MDKELFSKKYSNLLDKFIRDGYISHYKDINYCNGSDYLTLVFTNKFEEELIAKTGLTKNEIIVKLKSIIYNINDIFFKTDETHKVIAFKTGFKVI